MAVVLAEARMPRKLTFRAFPWQRATGGQAGVLVVLAAAAWISGCSSLFDDQYDFHEGWRSAEVVRVVSGEAVERPRFWRCTRRLTPEALAGRPYAVMAYQEAPYRPRKYVVPVPPDLDLRPGQHVYVNVFACDRAIALPRRATNAGQLGSHFDFMPQRRPVKDTMLALIAIAIFAGPAAFAQTQIPAASASAPSAKTYYWWLHPKLGMVKVDRKTNAMLVGRRAQPASASGTPSAN